MFDLDRVVDVLAETGVEVADQLLRTSGGLPPPTVHLLSKLLPEPYLGSVATRPYRRGEDAASAISALGLAPSAARASRIVVVWEYEDLLVSLQDPHAAGCPNGMVVVDADLSGHVVRWHPARFRMPGEHADAGVMVLPEWGAPVRHPGGELPGPVAQLLEVWREWHGGDVAAVLAQLEETGFLVSWRSEHDGVGQPVRR